MTLYRGYSLSLCVKDIIEGRRNVDDVAGIIAGTYINSEEGLWEVIKAYQQLYWSLDPVKAALIVQELFSEGLIEQPRLHGLPAPTLAQRNSIWEEWK